MIMKSHHGQDIEVIPGRTVLTYENGFLQSGRTLSSEAEAKRHIDIKRLAARNRTVVHMTYSIPRS